MRIEHNEALTSNWHEVNIDVNVDAIDIITWCVKNQSQFACHLYVSETVEECCIGKARIRFESYEDATLFAISWLGIKF